MSRGLFKKLWAVIGVIGVVFGIITSITGVGLYPMVSGFLTSHQIPLWVYILVIITIVLLVCVKPLSKLAEMILLHRREEVGQNSSRSFVAQPKSSTQIPFQRLPQSKGSGKQWAWPEKPDNAFLKFCYFIMFPLLPSAFMAIIFYFMFAWMVNIMLYTIMLSFSSVIFFLLIYISYIIIFFYQNKQSRIRDICGGVLMILTFIGCIFCFLFLIYGWIDGIDGNIPLIGNIIITSIDLCVLATLASSLSDLYNRA